MNLLEAENLAFGLATEESGTPGYAALLDQLQAALAEGGHTGLIFDAFMRIAARGLCKKLPLGHDIHDDGLYLGWDMARYDEDLVGRFADTVSSYTCGNIQPVFDSCRDLVAHISQLPDHHARGEAIGQLILFVRQSHEGTLDVHYEKEETP